MLIYQVSMGYIKQSCIVRSAIMALQLPESHTAEDQETKIIATHKRD